MLTCGSVDKEQNKAVPYFVSALLVMTWKNQLFLEAYDSHFQNVLERCDWKYSWMIVWFHLNKAIMRWTPGSVASLTTVSKNAMSSEVPSDLHFFKTKNANAHSSNNMRWWGLFLVANSKGTFPPTSISFIKYIMKVGSTPVFLLLSKATALRPNALLLA